MQGFGVETDDWFEVGFVPAGPLSQAAERLVEYEVHVFTSDVRGAGTDGDVFLQLVGDKGAMGETKLENSANKWVTANVVTACTSYVWDLCV